MSLPDGERVAELFHRAVERDAAQREAFVRGEAAGDEALAAEVLGLLAADRATTQDALRSPLHTPLGGAPAVIGEVLGRYRLLAELGEGGMGRVYRAEQLQPVRREVAVKVLRRGHLAAGPERARFEAEQRVLVRLEHANIARVLDGGVSDDGRPFLVMDLVDGVTLLDWVAQRQPSLELRLDVFTGVCEAVQHAHQKGVIHRDLKPSNVLVVEHGERTEPRVIDFGIARVLGGGEHDETLHTQRDVAMGTAGYMSPEQARDAASADARSDVYALGAVLYQLWTGALPRGRATGEGGDDAWAAPLRRPSQHQDAIAGAPADLDQVVLKALESDPERRYATVHEFVADVQRARAGLPVAARAPTLAYVARRFLRRHRVPAAIAAGAVLLLLASLVALLVLWNEADRNWNDYRRLVDDNRLADLRADARERLWPPWPATEPAMQQWQQRAEHLLTRRDDLQRRADELERSAESEPDVELQEELRYQRDVLRRLLAGIEHLVASEPHDDNIAGVLLRRREAHRIGRVSLREHAEDWSAAIAAIADPGRSPRYGGLQLPGAQVGLVPLGQDPRSGLWEFWHVGSGERPVVQRDPEGGYDGVTVAEASGMVFVLVPGGRFTMGALQRGDEHSGTAPIDPDAASMERFVHDVTLAPFFVGKHEVTQGQWLRLTGERPSMMTAQQTARGHAPDLRWPVEQVPYALAVRTLRRRGLQLPTEAQWEYAARAGSHSVFGGVAADAPLDRHMNLADAGSRGHLRVMLEPGLDDGFALSAPVGSFLPNGFGLHDCHGNVAEWCQDWLVSYVRPVRAGDGLRRPAADDAPTVRVMRGGDFAERRLLSRVAARNASPPEQRTARIGLRAVRSIQP
ncbi:MAG: bifunctional serine/threonine-protein kinase/formylglycine-generating enzyme family protein [Planctomycetota bacterium]